MMDKLLRPENCYLHIIDPQERLMSQIYAADRVSAGIKTMIHCARILDLPIIANTQYKKGLGLYVPELEALMTGINRFDKLEFNGLANHETRSCIQGLPDSVTTGILVGVETHICIYQTALGLQEIGMRPWVVTDAVSSRNQEYSERGLAQLQTMGVSSGPLEMIVYELLGKAGTAQFKAILPHII